MGYWDDWYYDRKPKREARGGIKAKSRRGKIGETWWSERFIKVLESFDIGARLSRGRSYARSGQVMDLEIKAGLVTSKVQGSRRTPYKVRIEIEPLLEDNWTRAEQAMTGQALFMAKLLAGEMPREIEEAFTASKLTLFPRSGRDLETDCSCPDWSNPCKHIAATYYILAEKFDEDPFLIFAWRGRTKEQIIERLRALRGATQDEDKPMLAHQFMPVGEDVAPLSDSVKNFWRSGAGLSTLRIRPERAEVPDAVLKQLGATGIEAGGEDLSDLLSSAYARVTDGAAAKAFNE